jgi:hypothetical protein
MFSEGKKLTDSLRLITAVKKRKMTGRKKAKKTNFPRTC